MPLRLNDSEFQFTDEVTVMTLLATSVHHWLSYVDKVSRTNLLLESSLRYAISEFVERKMHETCLLEQKHPHFPSRPIDFMWSIQKLDLCLDESNNLKVLCEDGTQNEAIDKILEDGYVLECKYASAATNGAHERQRIFNDLCRLYYVLEHYPNAHAMFMMAGEISDFESHFQYARTSKKTMKNTDAIKDDSTLKMSDIDIIGDNYVIKGYENFSSNKKISFKDSEEKGVTKYTIETSFVDWFGFDIENDRTKIIDTLEDNNKCFYNDFLSTYVPKDQKCNIHCSPAIKIKTELIAIVPTKDRVNTQIVAVWKVSKEG